MMSVWLVTWIGILEEGLGVRALPRNFARRAGVCFGVFRMHVCVCRVIDDGYRVGTFTGGASGTLSTLNPEL